MVRIYILTFVATIETTQRRGGATQFKKHLVGHEGNVRTCSSVRPGVRDFFHHELDRTAKTKRMKQQEKLLRGEICVVGNVVHDIDSEY
jgi:hypothetical protein